VLKLPYLCHCILRAPNKAILLRSNYPKLILKVPTNHTPPKQPKQTLSTLESVAQDYLTSWADFSIQYTSASLPSPQLYVVYKATLYLLPIDFKPCSSSASNSTSTASASSTEQEIKGKMVASYQRKLRQFFEHEPFFPLPHQQQLLDVWYARQGQDILQGKTQQGAFLLFYSMGSGKSQASLLPWSFYYVPRVVVLCENTMIETWVRFVGTLSQPANCIETTQFEILGLTEFGRIISFENPKFLKASITIFDEAHMFRNITEQMNREIEAICQAKQVFHLSGTPLVNSRLDLIGLGRIMMYKFTPKDIEQIQSSESDLCNQQYMSSLVEKIFRNRIHYYDPGSGNIQYAPVSRSMKYVCMSWRQVIDYLVMKKQDFCIGQYMICSSRKNSYHVKQKRCSNNDMHGGLSPKFITIIQDTLACPDPQIIYSNYLDNGVAKIFSHLKDHCKIELTTGTTSEQDRDDAFDRFNRGDIQVLCMSSIGGKGLNFKNCKVLRLVDAFESLQIENQAIARISRFRSHKKQNRSGVQAIKYISIFPTSYTLEEAKEAAKYFYETYCSSKWGTQGEVLGSDVEFMQELKDKMEKEEQGETIDQKLQHSNQVKQDLLMPILFQMTKLGTL
jgi:hypothetical protein